MVNIWTKNGQKRHIPDVYYSSSLKHNLINVGQLTKKGYDVIFNGNDSFIYDKPSSKMLMSRVKMKKNRMYPLSINYDRHNVSLPISDLVIYILVV